MIGRVGGLRVPLAAVHAMLGSVAWLTTQEDDFGRGFGPWGRVGGPMMGGNPRAGWLAGAQRWQE